MQPSRCPYPLSVFQAAETGVCVKQALAGQLLPVFATIVLLSCVAHHLPLSSAKTAWLLVQGCYTPDQPGGLTCAMAVFGPVAHVRQIVTGLLPAFNCITHRKDCK